MPIPVIHLCARMLGYYTGGGMNKYGARKTKLDGYTFDSQWEAERYQQLKLLERAGEIWGLVVCKGDVCKFNLHDQYISERTGKRVRPATYQPDFYYRDSDHNHCYEDAKGTVTAASKLKRKIVESRYEVTIWFVYADGRRE